MIRARPCIAVGLVAAVGLSGCGGHVRRAAPQPKLPRALAQELAVKSDDVARKLDAGDGCGAKAVARVLQQETIAAINAQQVPTAFQEPLLDAANGLVVGIQCAPPPPPPTTGGQPPGNGKHKGKGLGKHGGEGD